MAATQSNLLLLGTPISQPTRAVYWLLLISKIPFQIKEISPLTGETKTKEFLLLNPSGLIPVIIEELNNDKFVLTESGAILTYIAEKYHTLPELKGYYPDSSDLRGKAKVAAALHWHHHNTRHATLSVFRPIMLEIAFGKTRDQATKEKTEQILIKILKNLEEMLQNSLFILGDHPTIVDLQYYCEIDQLEALNVVDFASYPRLKKWVDAMKQLPFYQESHQALFGFANTLLAKQSKL